MSQIIDLLREMEGRKASDLMLAVGKKPAMRILGEMKEVADWTLEAATFDAFLGEHFPSAVDERLRTERDLDIGLSLSESERFRLNMFYQKGHRACVARRVPSGALGFDELRLPPVLKTFAEARRGLVLITGATGSGKSTTMAALLHHINEQFARHIVTIEDPIEFIHEDVQSMVTQREIGADTASFASSLKYVVRQSPDVIFIGEMRDFETIKTAISAAMTGHLVITTMHTVDVTQTVERVINFFPDYLRDQIAQDFALALQGIVSQRILPTADGQGITPALEVLVATPHVRQLISKRRLGEIEEALKAGSGEGMQTFNRSLVDLYQQELITEDTGAAAASNRDEFLLAIQGMETGIDTLRSSADGDDDSQISIRSLLKAAIRHGASDLLISQNCSPVLRINGTPRELSIGKLTALDTQKLLFSVLSPSQRRQFENDKEIDFALTVANIDGGSELKEMAQHRFRVNGFYQKGSVAAALRLITQTIPSPEELKLPPVVLELSQRQHGLILVTGPTGHGKSTTQACILNEINRTRPCHIITIEDPIEYVHHNDRAIIEQREVYADTKSFGTALKYVLRQDPDVILIGEMRDQETIGAALTAAETGHLVLGTLHTNDATQTVDRIVDTFPPHQQNQIRAQLAACLEGVVAQRLLPTVNGSGRLAVFEIMLGTPAVHALIRENKTHLLLSAIETGAKEGMITMDKALMNLYNRNVISRQVVKSLARDKSLV